MPKAKTKAKEKAQSPAAAPIPPENITVELLQQQIASLSITREDLLTRITATMAHAKKVMAQAESMRETLQANANAAYGGIVELEKLVHKLTGTDPAPSAPVKPPESGKKTKANEPSG